MTKLDFNSMKRQRESKEVETVTAPELQKSFAETWGTFPPVTKKTGDEEIVKLPLDKISPFKGKKGRKQPFKIDKQKVESLKASLKDVGVITPIIVRPFEDGYQILSGHHRFKASKELGFETIPAVVRNVPDDKVEAYIMEANIQRVKLLPTEYGNIFERYMELRKDLNVSVQEVVEKFGVSKKSLYRYINVIKCTPDIQDLIDSDKINVDCADLIKSMSEEEQQSLAEYVGTLDTALTTPLLKDYLDRDNKKDLEVSEEPVNETETVEDIESETDETADSSTDENASENIETTQAEPVVTEPVKTEPVSEPVTKPVVETSMVEEIEPIEEEAMTITASEESFDERCDKVLDNLYELYTSQYGENVPRDEFKSRIKDCAEEMLI